MRADVRGDTKIKARGPKHTLRFMTGARFLNPRIRAESANPGSNGAIRTEHFSRVLTREKKTGNARLNIPIN